jgi:RND superfamily putative drug exporter
MVLLGDANWWLPRWLDRRLPSVDLEGDRRENGERWDLPALETRDEERAEPVPGDERVEVGS